MLCTLWLFKQWANQYIECCFVYINCMPKIKFLFSGATFHIPLTIPATLNRLLHCSLWQFSGALFYFWGLFFAFWGRNRPEPPCIFFQLIILIQAKEWIHSKAAIMHGVWCVCTDKTPSVENDTPVTPHTSGIPNWVTGCKKKKKKCLSTHEIYIHWMVSISNSYMYCWCYILP